MLQKQELRAQRQELELNREVLMLQADELKKSAAQLGAQAEILAKQLKAQSEQKALADIKEGIAGLRSILVVKLCGSSLVARSGGNLRLDSLVGSDGLNELGNGEFIEEFCVRLERSFRIINKGLQEKHQITIKKRPTRDELQKMLAAIDRILKIPDQEDCAELRTKFELEYPLPKLRRLLSDCEALVK